MKLFCVEINPDEKRTDDVLNFLEAIFGTQEKELEYPQLRGMETDKNIDVLVCCEDGGKLVSSCHITSPKTMPALGALSAMFVVPEMRGKHYGRETCRYAIQKASEMGIDTLFLGTSNPVAACMYTKLGFEFISGSNVMFRSESKQTFYEFQRDCFHKETGRIIDGNASMRIPIVPLVLSANAYDMLDANTELFSNQTLVQKRCSGLYQKYVDFEKCGGTYVGYVGDTGALYALASGIQTEFGYMVDGFGVSGYEDETIMAMEYVLQGHDNVYVLSLKEDYQKHHMLEKMNLVADMLTTYKTNNLQTDVIMFRRKPA